MNKVIDFPLKRSDDKYVEDHEDAGESDDGDLHHRLRHVEYQSESQ